MYASLVATTPMPRRKLTILNLALIVGVILLPACSTVSVSQLSPEKAISLQRGNLVSSNKLSSNTASSLLSAGLNQQACMQHFDLCLEQLSDSILDSKYRPRLAAFAELHYGKALQLADSQDCRNALARPPIDPYYANAPLSPEQETTQKKNTATCLNTYQERLFDAVKLSYAYLFYDQLDHDFADADNELAQSVEYHRIPNDIDIQTQDIYNAASNDIITRLYKSRDNLHELIEDADVKYLPIISAAADTNRSATISNQAPLKGDLTDQVKVMTMNLNNYDLNVYLPNENNYLQNARDQKSALADLTSTYEMRLSGLNTISQRPGLGVKLVASLDDRYTTTVRQLLASSLSGRLTKDESQLSPEGHIDDSTPTSRIYPTGHLLITGLIKPTGKGVLEVLNSKQLNIHLYNPYRTNSVPILDDDYPLAANFSAGYGLWLAENQLSGVGYLNLLARKQEANLPKLFMLEPYDPDKRVLIMIHGLASSPATWVNLTNDILSDDKLRENYQVWQIFYPTNLPILENRYEIQKLLTTAYQQTDPQGQNRASSNSVIIGHSMGAVIARMMLSDDNLEDDIERLDEQNLLSYSEKKQIIDVLKQAFGEEKLNNRFELQTLPQVDTAVFLSAPFRGTDYADRWFTRALRRIIHIPVGLVKTVTDNLATIFTQGDLTQNPLGALYLENGASQLSDKSSFIQLTKDININERITYHSIIASNDDDITRGLAQMQPGGGKIDLSQAPQKDDNNSANSTPRQSDRTNSVQRQPLVAAVTVNEDISQALTERLSDGIVPYTSAHLDGAASETIISGGHSVQENPQTILTLRRILRQQLQQ
ncbi:esterase/lipase family protein [Psychrobacter jeotgali]|uniref:esterase/lipase family protein n=1 Tax=Psychrobacter jeotgali TaxID=179010 RepID=UPI001D12B438|nr:alpha/beta hydrolase [Psychrobacter jeotgali]